MKKTLVFGASIRPYRYSNLALRRLVQNGIDVEAFGLRSGSVAGVEIQTNLESFKQIDTVTLYMNPGRQREFYDQILSLKPRRVIFNPGTENPEFYKLLDKKGIEVEVACTLVLLATGSY